VGAPFLWGPLFGRTCLNPPQLVADALCGLRWFCDACDKIAIDTGHDHDSATSSGRIDKLVDLVQKLLENMSMIDDRLNEKCELMEARVKKVEERVTEGRRISS